jgi:hypothetical protein
MLSSGAYDFEGRTEDLEYMGFLLGADDDPCVASTQQTPLFVYREIGARAGLNS